MTLKSSIRQAERSIVQRRSHICAALDGVSHTVSKRMVSPDVLVAAGLFGAALHRDHRLHGLQILVLLQAKASLARSMRPNEDISQIVIPDATPAESPLVRHPTDAAHPVE